MTAVSSAARRVTVVTPRSRVDVALPVESTLAELVPQLVRLTGADSLAEPSARNGMPAAGWGLARLGEPTLEPGLTVAGAGLHDGDVIYLQQRDRNLGPLLFDDVVDAIANAAATRQGLWRPLIARRAAVVAATLTLAAAAIVVQIGSNQLIGSVTPGVFALVALLAAFAVGRAYRDGDLAAGTAAAGAIPALLAGGRAVSGTHAWPWHVDSLAVGLACLAGYALLAAIGVGAASALFIGLALASAFGAATCAAVRLVPSEPLTAAAVSLVLATLFVIATPVVAARLARLPLPRVPTDIESFRTSEDADIDPALPATAERAEHILAGLLAALAAVAVGCGLVLVLNHSAWGWGAVGVAAVGWLTRSRGYRGTVQRMIPLAAGAALTGLFVVRASHELSHTWVLVTAAGSALVALLCLGYGARQGRGLQSPYWGRVLDVLEYTSLIGLLPATAAALGVFGKARGLGG